MNVTFANHTLDRNIADTEAQWTSLTFSSTLFKTTNILSRRCLTDIHRKRCSAEIATLAKEVDYDFH